MSNSVGKKTGIAALVTAVVGGSIYFALIFGNTLVYEGQSTCSNHPDDLGKKTRWGITEAVARQHGYSGDVCEMPRETAEQIAKTAYWDPLGLDEIAELSTGIAAELFDTGYNMGPRWPAVFLQRCLNVFNRQGTDYPDVAVDGKIGPATARALESLLRARPRHGEEVIMECLNSLQGARYVEITEARPAHESFSVGWFIHRVE